MICHGLSIQGARYDAQTFPQGAAEAQAHVAGVPARSHDRSTQEVAEVALSVNFESKSNFERVKELTLLIAEDPGDTYLVRKLVIEELPRVLTKLESVYPDGGASMCVCGHVTWAHWPNGRCAHCDCMAVQA